MSETEDPPRLKDLGGASVSLLRAASRVPAMSSEDRAAIVAGIGAAASTGTATTTSATSAGNASSAAGGALASKGLLAGLAGVVVVGGVVASFMLASPAPSTQEAAPASLSAPAASQAVPDAPGEALPEAPAAVPAASSVPVVEAPVAAPRPSAPVATPAAARAPARASASASASPAGESSLAAESALIGKARGLLESDPRGSLALLDEHRRRHPRGELAAERDFLSIKALRRLGQTDEARARARSYPARYPSSPYTPAVQGILAELGGP